MRSVRIQFRVLGKGCFASTRRIAVAFTLIELLIAVAVFAIVLLAINSVFYSALRLRARTVQITDELFPTHRALAIIKRDLAGIVLPGGMLAGALNSGESAGLAQGPQISLARPIVLQVFTSSGIIDEDEPWGDIQKVDYLLQDSTNNVRAAGKDLIRSVTRNLLATGADQSKECCLISDVQALQFSFFDGTNWLSRWDSLVNPGAPTAVRVSIQRAGTNAQQNITAPIEFVVPVAVRGGTNEVSEAGGAG